MFIVFVKNYIFLKTNLKKKNIWNKKEPQKDIMDLTDAGIS